MFIKLYKARIKCLCKSRNNMFWSFAFPLMLAIFFYMGFYNINNGEILDTIPIAVIDENNTSNDFLSNMKAVEISDGKQMFLVQYHDLNTAKELLHNDKIEGYIVCSDTPTLYIKENGMNQTIIKSYMDTYEHIKQTARNITALSPKTVESRLHKELANYQNYVGDFKDQSRRPNYSLIYFYSLIALTCMFGTNWGFDELLNIQADQSAIGARISVAPTHKMKLIVSNLAAAFTLHFTSVVFLLAFLNFILKIDFGDSLWRILLICFLGCICGITLGAMVCVTILANVRMREAILNIIVLGGGFLSGLMLVEMKYLIATKAPILGYINPTNLITDALYCLYYYDGYGKYFLNVVMLGLLTIVFALITFSRIRRKVYASI